MYTNKLHDLAHKYGLGDRDVLAYALDFIDDTGNEEAFVEFLRNAMEAAE